MGNKEKGANTERELLHKFIEEGWLAIRIAGSGLLPDPSCDLIAGKHKKKFCIEVKSCKKPYKYLNPEQIEQFMIFSQIFGLKPLIALRFNREGWFFLKPEHLEKKDKSLFVSLEKAREKGKRFGQAFS